MNEYKLEQLRAMLKAERDRPESEQYGAHLQHWAGTSKSINIDAGAIKALIRYYERQEQNRNASK